MTDEQAIRNLIDRWLAATEAGDNETVLSMVADDVVFLGAGTPRMRGKEEFAARQAGMKGVRIEAIADTQEIRVLGDYAWCWNQLHVSVTPPGADQPIVRSGPALTILQNLGDGRWVILRDANMLAEDGKENAL